MKYSQDKDTDRFVQSPLADGWTFQRRTRHGCLRSPSGEVAIVACTPGCQASLKALASRVRRIRPGFRSDASRDPVASRTGRQKLTPPPTSSHNAPSPMTAVPELHLALVPTAQQPYTCSRKVAGYLRHG